MSCVVALKLAIFFYYFSSPSQPLEGIANIGIESSKIMLILYACHNGLTNQRQILASIKMKFEMEIIIANIRYR